MKRSNLFLPLAVLSLGLAISSCKKEEVEEPTPTPTPPAMQSETYTYEFNNGQVVPSAAYMGSHNDNLYAVMEVDEVSASETMISVTLYNTVDGEMYAIHAHDAADPNTTPNGTPYDETPNSNVFTQMVTGNGGMVTASQNVSMSFSDITTMYEGFFVVHDPLQGISTTDISTYLVVGSFARMQTATNFSSSEFMYDFNTGQVDPNYAYMGTHANTLMGTLRVQELADGQSRVSVWLDNTMNGETYMVHAHDAADPNTTPNGTPYDETPNSNVCTLMINGNGMTAGGAQVSTMSHDDITSMYSGFFVVHDPLQPIDTTDPTTYLLLGAFAQ
ncbi:MAG: hypothetical protein NXI10_08165 [bacterium]|nr:hypothetical protein [bacterium]